MAILDTWVRCLQRKPALDLPFDVRRRDGVAVEEGLLQNAAPASTDGAVAGAGGGAGYGAGGGRIRDAVTGDVAVEQVRRRRRVAVDGARRDAQTLQEVVEEEARRHLVSVVQVGDVAATDAATTAVVGRKTVAQELVSTHRRLVRRVAEVPTLNLKKQNEKTKQTIGSSKWTHSEPAVQFRVISSSWNVQKKKDAAQLRLGVSSSSWVSRQICVRDKTQ